MTLKYIISFGGLGKSSCFPLLPVFAPPSSLISWHERNPSLGTKVNPWTCLIYVAMLSTWQQHYKVDYFPKAVSIFVLLLIKKPFSRVLNIFSWTFKGNSISPVYLRPWPGAGWSESFDIPRGSGYTGCLSRRAASQSAGSQHRFSDSTRSSFSFSLDHTD